MWKFFVTSLWHLNEKKKLFGHDYYSISRLTTTFFRGAKRLFPLQNYLPKILKKRSSNAENNDYKGNIIWWNNSIECSWGQRSLDRLKFCDLKNKFTHTKSLNIIPGSWNYLIFSLNLKYRPNIVEQGTWNIILPSLGDATWNNKTIYITYCVNLLCWLGLGGGSEQFWWRILLARREFTMNY